MPMGYNPNGYDPEKEGRRGGKVPDGDYDFVIDNAIEDVFKSGNEGAKLRLGVHVGDRTVRAFDVLVYLESTRWKIKQLFDCIGVDFFDPPEVHELIGRCGRARFEADDSGYIRPVEYHASGANNVPRATPVDRGPPPMSDDQVPF